MAISENIIESVIFELMRLASIELPKDVKRVLQEIYEKEENPTARSQMEAIFENCRIAEEKQVGVCQDTGMPVIFAGLGLNCVIEGDPNIASIRAIEHATKAIPLRENVINPLTKHNSGTNVGQHIPYWQWDVVPGADYLDILVAPKGFGSEIRTTQSWVLTSDDVGRATVRAALDIVADSMGEPCPPIIIGMGIGGFGDTSMILAKRATFRAPIGSRNADPIVAALEEEIENAVNSLDLGPMGFGGKTYAMGVHIELSGSHTAIVPISIIFQCWACRYSKARIYHDGRVEFITHPQGSIENKKGVEYFE